MLPNYQKCTGCGACAVVCPRDCIEMPPDREGFRYPVVDQVKCVNCHACEQVCPVLDAPQCGQMVRGIGARNNDNAVRRQSSSGGVFTALALWVLGKGGVVCAAAYDERFAVTHRICRKEEDLAELRGAKYAQSRTEHCFPELQKSLKQGVQVLFVGTPCQVAALRNFLKKEYENLLLVDMICHGVPSPKVWEAYLRKRQSIDAPESRLSAVNLRSKKTGWSKYGYCVEMRYDDGTVYQVPQGQDLFMQGFVKNLYLRHSCGDCAFKGLQRCSDVTLGDFWGIWDLAPEMDDDQGTSLVLLHSHRGVLAWESVQQSFAWLDVPVERALEQNPSAVCSSEPHPRRAEFFLDFESDFSLALLNEYLVPPEEKVPLWKRMIRKLNLR